jgi:hypothetical protein
MNEQLSLRDGGTLLTPLAPPLLRDSEQRSRGSVSPADKRVKVVYILGAWRSGTTLLDRLLGQVDGFFSTGELKVIWDRLVGHVWGYDEQKGADVLCGCGTPFTRCSFWADVFRKGFRGMENVDPRRMFELSASLLRVRHIPHLLFPFLSRKFRKDLEFFSQTIGTLYRAILQESGCRVLVDSSKINKYCVVLSRIRDIDLHVIHIIRDSRAVAYSWLRKKKRPEVYWANAFERQIAVGASARNWLGTHCQTLLLRPYFKQYLRLRYEDLVADPRGTMVKVCAAIGEREPRLDFLDNQTAHLGKAHTVAGNAIRFQEGPVQVVPDTEWREKLTPSQQRIVTAITWPLLMYYRYPLRVPRQSLAARK